ncbi:hypothetical protein OR571_03150 [Psychrobacillus sp. NEAU-3TGS]|uniref:hypothetical protein n=1 Tax=Psychrobacillus sp. NEAU-3TGS TaxID=2995412 RepID=UPI002495C08F|nr:hypothetical protein [Psychrobacillus sp. NEAU-3TGS]MDI2586147.1 hypothetical protein [Psychrobacillus sp. NEAU-3TGS]
MKLQSAGGLHPPLIVSCVAHDVAYLVWDHSIGRMPAVDLPLIFSFFFNLEVGVLLPVNAG